MNDHRNKEQGCTCSDESTYPFHSDHACPFYTGKTFRHEQPSKDKHDVIDRIVERNRLFWIALHGPGNEDDRRKALEKSFQDDPFEESDPEKSP